MNWPDDDRIGKPAATAVSIDQLGHERAAGRQAVGPLAAAEDLLGPQSRRHGPRPAVAACQNDQRQAVSHDAMEG
jgi:hypothetical protein